MATTFELIASQALGSAAAYIEFTSIPATYDDLVLVASLRTDGTNRTIDVTFNGSGTGYSYRRLSGNGSVAQSASGSSPYFAYGAGSGDTSNTFGWTEIYIPNYAGSANKSFSSFSGWETNATGASMFAQACLWSSTASITSIKIDPTVDTNLVTASSAYLFGVTHA